MSPVTARASKSQTYQTRTQGRNLPVFPTVCKLLQSNGRECICRKKKQKIPFIFFFCPTKSVKGYELKIFRDKRKVKIGIKEFFAVILIQEEGIVMR